MGESGYYDGITVETKSVVTTSTTSSASEERITVRIEREVGWLMETIPGDSILVDAHLSDNIAFIKHVIWLKAGWNPGLCITFPKSPNAHRQQTYRHSIFREIRMPVVAIIKHAMTPSFA
jgi:hypothetical protein